MVRPRSRRAPRRKVARRKMTMRRRAPLGSQRKIYSFRRTCEAKPWVYFDGAWSRQQTNIVGNYSGATSYRGIFKFKLDDLPNYTDFTNLYENFRITGVKLKFLPYLGTETSAPNSSATVMEPLALCIDRGANDQIGSNPTFTSLLENQDVKIRSTYKPFSMYIAYPKAHGPADGVSQTTLISPWLDTETFGSVVDHHGMKYCFQDTGNIDRYVAFRVYATYYVKCRGPQ